MTTNDTTTTDQTEETAPEATEPPEDAQEATETDEEPRNKEAARYRRRARDAEAERDTLAGRVAAYQTSEAERLAAGPGLLLDPADLWRATELPALLGEDGELDPALVTAAVESVVSDHPHYQAPPAPDIDLDLGTRGGIGKPHEDRWASAFKPG